MEHEHLWYLSSHARSSCLGAPDPSVLEGLDATGFEALEVETTYWEPGSEVLEALLRSHPWREVRLAGEEPLPEGVIDALCDLELLALHLGGRRAVSLRQFARLCASHALRGLQILTVEGAALGAGAARALDAATFRRGLYGLWLSETYLGDSGLEELAKIDWGSLETVRVVDWHACTESEVTLKTALEAEEGRDVFVAAFEGGPIRDDFTVEQTWGAVRAMLHGDEACVAEGVRALIWSDEHELDHRLREYVASHEPVRVHMRTGRELLHASWRLLRSPVLEMVDVVGIELEVAGEAELRQLGALIDQGGVPGIRHLTLRLALELGSAPWVELDLAIAFPDLVTLRVEPLSRALSYHDTVLASGWLHTLSTWLLPRSLQDWAISRGSLTIWERLEVLRDLARAMSSGSPRRLVVGLPLHIQDSDSHWDWLKQHGLISEFGTSPARPPHLAPGVEVSLEWY